MFRKTLITALAGVAISLMTATTVAAQNWSGFYGGAQIGYGDVDVSGAASAGGDGSLGGFHLGYNLDYGTWVLGGELDYDFADIDFGTGVSGSIDDIARLKLKVGSKVGNSLIYGTVGPAYAKASVGGASFSDTGYFGGVGIAVPVGSGMIVGGEALLHRFNNFDASGLDIDAATLSARLSFSF